MYAVTVGVRGPPDRCRVLAGKITVRGWHWEIGAYPGHASSNARHRRRHGPHGHNMCRWRGGGVEKAWRTRRLVAGPGRVIEWWPGGWENQTPPAAVAAGSLRRGKRKMRIRTGALAVLVAAVVLTAFCVHTTSLAASAPSGDAAGASPAPDRTATSKSAERRIGSASHDRRRLSLLWPRGVWLS